MDFEYEVLDREIKSEKTKKELCLEVQMINRYKKERPSLYKKISDEILKRNKIIGHNNFKKSIKINNPKDDGEEYLNGRFINKYALKGMDNENFIFYDKIPISRN